MDNPKIYRAAVGQIANLGEFYDARKDEFLCINAFDRPLKDEDISETEISSSNVDLILTDLVTEQFDKLDINGQLALSILCDLVKLSGSATYLNSHRNSANSAHTTLTYSVRTKYQEVNGIRNKVNADSLNATGATHILVGIEWGAKCNITCECQKNGNENIANVRGQMEIEMEKLKCALSVESSAKVDDGGKGKVSSASRFSYHTKCDVSDLEKDIPTTFEGALAVATSFPKAVTKTNNGKGVPLTYTLLSLNWLRKMCDLDIKLDEFSKQIEDHIARKCFQAMQVIIKSRQQIIDLIGNFNGNNDAVPSKELDTANELLSKFEIEEAKFKSELGRCLIEARSGHNNGISAIEDVLKLYHEGDLSPEKVNTTIRQYERTIQKLKYINELKDNQVLYIGEGGSVELALFHNAKRKVYAFYMDYTRRSSKDKKWQQHQKLFFRLVSAHNNDKEVKLIVIDCELLPEVTPKKGMCIEFYENGILCCKDLVHEEGQDVEDCVVKLIVREPLKPKPNKRVPLEISCPKSFCGSCAKGECQWICKYCKEIVEYGIDDQSLYCRCGKSSTFDAKFRCKDTTHGLSFVKFNPNIMRQILSSLRSVKETNIILLGETGVGRSTWINAIANYFAFETLQVAREAKDLKVCIPSQFSYTSENGKTERIFVGSEVGNANENQPGTQEPRTYRLIMGNRTINLIDTPPIGAVQDLEQDYINIQNILAHLSHYDEINGICIFLKSNSSGSISTFKFCITELLTHLHKSAAENIVFCFTNVRSTFYRPGDTLQVLKPLLREHTGGFVSISRNNQFCFDSEAFRFLACLKNGVQFSEQDIDTYSSSWDTAVTETKRLFKHIQNLKPHSVKDTIKLNNGRIIILELSEFLRTTGNVISTIESFIRATSNASKEEIVSLGVKLLRHLYGSEVDKENFVQMMVKFLQSFLSSI